MDGENREVLVDSSKMEIQWPNGITLDYLNRKLYWVDAKYNSINSYTLHTGEMEQVGSPQGEASKYDSITLKVEKFACTNFRDRNFRED